MRKIKVHLISILLIVILSIFALGTSYSVNTELKIINNSSGNLVLKIFSRDYERIESPKEYQIKVKKSISIKYHGGRRDQYSPEYYIHSILIYSENGDLIKEFICYTEDIENTENIELNNYYSEPIFKYIKQRRRSLNHTYYYVLEITNKLLK